MPRDGLLLRIRDRVLEAWHCLSGSYHRWRGDLEKARAHYQRALDFDEGSFRAHVHLGRIHLEMHQYQMAADELNRAREIDRHRWANELFPGDPILWMADQVPEQRLRRGLGDRDGLGPRDEGIEVGGLEDGDAESLDDLPFGDFVDRGEAERFSLLPPIALSEVDEIDWAELGRQLIEED